MFQIVKGVTGIVLGASSGVVVETIVTGLVKGSSKATKVIIGLGAFGLGWVASRKVTDTVNLMFDECAEFKREIDKKKAAEEAKA